MAYGPTQMVYHNFLKTFFKMKIKLELFGASKDLSDKDFLELKLSSNSSISDLRNEIINYVDKNYDEFYGCKVGYNVTKVGENFEVKLTSNEFITLKDILLDIRK